MISVLTQRMMKLGAMTAVRGRKFVYAGTPPPPHLHYFAYGANLSTKRFDKYQMNVEPVGVAKLDKHALRFSLPCEYLGKGYASADPDPQREVWGFLYKIDPLSLFLLDVMEWKVLNQYRRVTVNVIAKDGKIFQAETYQSAHPQDGLSPSAVYKNLILQSSRNHDFPQTYIHDIESTPSRETFDLDPGFSFLMPGRRRYFEKALRKPYLWHDRFREIVCEKLTF